MLDDDVPLEEAAPAAPEETGADQQAAGAADPDPALRLAAIEAALGELVERLGGESERAAARERVIDRQHAQIEQLRTAERTGTLRPVMIDLCRLRNDLLRQASTLAPDITVDRFAALLESFAGSVEEALQRYGVEVLPRQLGEPFAPGRQQVARVVEVEDPDRDGTVAEVVNDGYAEIDSGRVVMPTRVVVQRAVTLDANGTKEHVDA
jgi:molecular chaperone GrpE (heat shock protein)